VSDATYQLLTSADFFTAIVIGAIGVAIVSVLAVVVSRPFRFGGIVFAIGILVALERIFDVPERLLFGAVLLAVAGFVPRTSKLLAMVAIVPGAVVVAMARIADGSDAVVLLVAAMITVLAPLVASFDEQFASSGVAAPLMAISMVSVFLTVPDTEFALLAAGASLPWLVAGPPARLARLGRAGAYVMAGLLVWLVFEGGSARTVALVAGVATLGVLIVQPVVTAALGDKPKSRSEGSPGSPNVVASVVAAHIAIQALAAIAVRV